jgi:hypothetical protein
MKRSPTLLDGQPACWDSSPASKGMEGRRARWHAAASQASAWSCLRRRITRWHAGHGRRPSPLAWCTGGRFFCSWRLGTRPPTWPRWLASHARSYGNGRDGFWPHGGMAALTLLAVAPRAVFPPAVAMHVVRLACERPDRCGRRLSHWDGAALARPRVEAGRVAARSAATRRRILAAPPRQPWRQQLWRYPKHPRAADCDATVSDVSDLSTRPLADDEIVLALEEQTSRPPRPRLAPTRPAQPQNLPKRDAHEDTRAGARNLCAAFETRSGQV